MTKVVSVFAGSKLGDNPAFAADALQLAEELARARVGVVCGGGQSGLMGIFIEAATKRGVPVTGVMVRNRTHDETPSHHLTSVIEVGSLALRKETIVAHADAIIALPGGVGVIDEICHSWALGRLNQLDKQLFVINTAGYFDDLKRLTETVVVHGFAKATGFAPIFCSPREAAISL